MEDEAKRWCDAVFPPDCEQFLANSDGNFDKEKKKKSTLRRKIEKRDRSKTNTALEIPKIDLSGNISPKKDPPTPRQNSFRSLRGSSAVMVGDKRAHKKSSEDLIGRGPIVHNNEHFYHDSELFDHRVHADKTDVVLLELQGANVTLKSIPFPSQIRISQVDWFSFSLFFFLLFTFTFPGVCYNKMWVSCGSRRTSLCLGRAKSVLSYFGPWPHREM